MLFAYIDGSYSPAVNKYGSGIVFVRDDEIVDTYNFSGYSERYLSAHNVAGEISAATYAMGLAYNKYKEDTLICYDYEGIEKWATGTWRANKPISQDYVKIVDQLRKSDPVIRILFYKIKAHSGSKYNELADRLAKESLLLSTIT